METIYEKVYSLQYVFSFLCGVGLPGTLVSAVPLRYIGREDKR